MQKKHTLTLTYAALCLALGLVLPFLTGQIPSIGKALAPMHIAVFLCGFLCGGPYGLLIGFIMPLLRTAIFGMPQVPDAICMAFELAAYGFLSGFLYSRLPKKVYNIYISLLAAMVFGRLVWGVARLCLAGISGTAFTLTAFWAGAVTVAMPGIICHIVLIPILVMALEKTKMMPHA